MATLLELKNAWKAAVDANANLQNDAFRVAEQFDAAINGNDSYPFVHLELPFNVIENTNMIEVRYAVTIVDYLPDGEDPFNTLDNCMAIWYQMLKYIRTTYKNSLTIENNWQAITLTEYSDDNTHGVRVEIVSRLLKNYLC